LLLLYLSPRQRINAFIAGKLDSTRDDGSRRWAWASTHPWHSDPGIQHEQLQPHGPFHDKPHEPHVLPVVDVAADAHTPKMVVPETLRYLPFWVGKQPIIRLETKLADVAH
jgi:hypothetical protein